MSTHVCNVYQLSWNRGPRLYLFQYPNIFPLHRLYPHSCWSPLKISWNMAFSNGFLTPLAWQCLAESVATQLLELQSGPTAAWSRPAKIGWTCCSSLGMERFSRFESRHVRFPERSPNFNSVVFSCILGWFKWWNTACFSCSLLLQHSFGCLNLNWPMDLGTKWWMKEEYDKIMLKNIPSDFI